MPTKKKRRRNSITDLDWTRLRTALKVLEKYESTSVNTYYILNDNERDVGISTVIGAPGQTSHIGMYLDNSQLKLPNESTVQDFVIGTTSKLRGKTLIVIAQVTDTSADTDNTSFELIITGGYHEKSYPLSQPAAAPGGTVDYLCIIKFV